MKHIVISALYLLILFCLSHFVFDPSYLYYEIWWLDIPMHILGGFGVAALASAILSYNDIKPTFGKLFIAFMVIAIGWEIYEYILHILYSAGLGGTIDTIKDLIDGFIGMIVAYLFVRK